MRRRAALVLGAALVVGVPVAGCARGGSPGTTPATPATPVPSGTVPPGPLPSEVGPPDAVDPPALDALEEETGVRVGVFAVDTATGRTVAHRADERFGFASTTKALSAALVLAATTDEQLDAPLPVDAAAVVAHSPVTRAQVGTGTTLRTAAEAAVTVSDNTAQNLLLDALGGPGGFGRALRAIGDTTTDPRRREPALNDVDPGRAESDTADTSTPRALATSLRTVAVDDARTGGALSADDRAQLVEWLWRSTTGATTIRAGMPGGWLVGSRTGTGSGHGIRNDIAVVWPDGDPDAAPVVLAVLTDRADPDAGPRDDVLARAARTAVDAVLGRSAGVLTP